jgi:hypothetical protein
MGLDDIKKRFVEEVKLRAFDDKYIDRNEEREILQIAIQQNITIDSARAALAQVCDSQGYVLESRVLNEIKDLLDTFAGNDGVISEKEFNDSVAQLRKRCNNKKNEVQCKKMIIEIIEDNSYKVKTGLFSNWYAKIKKDVGMA